MKLALHRLCEMHPKLRGQPTDLSVLGALALQREGHASPVPASFNHDGQSTTGEIEWLTQDMKPLEVLDTHRVTEDGAEAVALAYVHAKDGWVVKRRLNRGECADWLLSNEACWLALEVSGTAHGEPLARLEEKKCQVARCSLLADRLAIVVAFRSPSLFAGSV